MKQLEDFFALSRSSFWTKVAKKSDAAEKTLQELWEKAGTQPLTQSEAVDCLDALFIHTHQRIRNYKKGLYKHFPTKQCNKNRLKDKTPLWWVDHFTAGIHQWRTLSWFSSKKVTKKNGKQGYAGASTHFIQGYEGYPFYIIPLMHGAWHEPHRNKDSIAIEMVNAGNLHRDKKTDRWHFWAGPLPEKLVISSPPVRLNPPYRGCKVMQPYTTEQIINNIKLKRIIRAALPGKIDADFMSAHTDWREGKTDTGPLWPYPDVNSAVFDTIPIEQYVFIQRYDVKVANAVADVETFEYDEVDNPEYGEETPTHEDDPDSEVKILSTKKVQEYLIKLGHRLTVDGKYGAKTKAAITSFQETWNNEHPEPKEQLKVDGKAGPRTCACLKQRVR